MSINELVMTLDKLQADINEFDRIADTATTVYMKHLDGCGYYFHVSVMRFSDEVYCRDYDTLEEVKEVIDYLTAGAAIAKGLWC